MNSASDNIMLVSDIKEVDMPMSAKDATSSLKEGATKKEGTKVAQTQSAVKGMSYIISMIYLNLMIMVDYLIFPCRHMYRFLYHQSQFITV